MDHLPSVPNATVPGLEVVPYVCKKSYDNGPFLTYPVRENRPEIVPDAAIEGKASLWEYERLHPTPNEEFEAFCQTWLFFGMIHEFLGNICTSADFLRPGIDGTSSIISTAQLPALVERWVTSVQDGSSSLAYEHVAQCLRLTHTTLMATGPDFDLSVKFCIASVGELFEYAANRAFEIGNLVLENACPTSWRRPFGETARFERLLGRSGWCPSQINIMVSSPASMQSLYFFASMHDSVSAGRHDLCDNVKCVAYQTDLENYATQHVTKTCRCEEFCVDISSLNNILQTGALALLRIRGAETLDQLTVEVVASQPDSQYLALSHVWADGLGNAKANALPRCQLLQLGKFTQSLSAKLNLDDPQYELFFWCDTLCCPVSPGEGKNRVLAQMKSIYEQATCVLVLDASLEPYKSETMRPEEACARIIASGWMRRLWTLQEGALSADKGRLWFQFRDEAVHFRFLWQEIVRMFNSDSSRKGLATDFLTWIGFLRKLLHRETGADLATVDAAFENRSISVCSDEPLLIGTLLGLDVASILNGSHETRSHRMWSLMPAAVRGIPKHIVFRLGPRLKEEGYRWAPSTMLHHESTNAPLSTMLKGDNQGIPTEQGLRVRLSGYHISFPQRPKGLPVSPWNLGLNKESLYMRDDEACWYIARRRLSNAEGDYLSKDNFSSIVEGSFTDLWITLQDIEYQMRADTFLETRTALLTRLKHETHDVKYVHSYMHMNVSQYRTDVCEMLEATYRCAQKLAESAPAQRLANMSENEIDMESPDYKALFDTLEAEILRISASGEYDRGLVLARERSRRIGAGNGDELFGFYVRLMFTGQYAIVGPRTPDSQQWCVD